MEIIKGEALKKGIISGLEKLSTAVLATMGPNGRTVIIHDLYDKPYVTKDGVSVAKSIVLKDAVENIAVSLIKGVAEKTVDEAGDGTTTSICLAKHIILKGYELLEQGISYNEIKIWLEEMLEETVEELQRNATILDPSSIVDVATISANNDTEIGSLIQEAFNHAHYVKVEEGAQEKDILITVEGMQLNSSYFDKAFINNPSKQAIDQGQAKLLIVQGNVDKIETISTFLKGVQDLPIVIMADHFSEQVVSILKDNYNRGALDIGLLKSPGFAQHRKDLVEDIIAFTNAYTSTGNKDVKYAIVDGIFADKNNIIIRKDNADVSERVKNLKSVLSLEEDASSKDLLTQRINNLAGKLSIIKVGGKSELEMKERFDRYDDAVLAVKCALEEGVIKGGGVPLYRLAHIGHSNPFFVTLASPFETMFPGATSIPELNKVVDPVKVTRTALANAVSVAKTILSTEVVVLNQ